MSDNAPNKRGIKIGTSYISTVIGVALVLFFLGIIALLLLSTNTLKTNVKEQIGIDVFFKTTVGLGEITQIEKSLKKEDYIVSAGYVSSEQALDEIRESIGGDLIEDVNGIPPSIEVNLKETHANLDSVKVFENRLMALHGDKILEIHYDPTRFKDVNENLNKILYMIFAIAILLLVIAVAMINNTIRLAIYSKRFLIKTMQLVGAKSSFIRRPFLWQSLLQGVLASIIASAMLLATTLIMENQFPDISLLIDVLTLLELFGITFILGMLITWLSTFFALRKYIRARMSKLY